MSDEPQREAKYMSIVKAENKVKAAKYSLQELLGEVTGNKQPQLDKEKAELEPSYNLVSVLNNSGHVITEVADNILSLIVELRKEIL